MSNGSLYRFISASYGAGASYKSGFVTSRVAGDSTVTPGQYVMEAHFF